MLLSVNMRNLNLYLQYSLFILPLLVISASSSNSSKFLDCAPKLSTCGHRSYNLSYPFRTPGMPPYCGHPGFDLTCSHNNSTLLIKIDGEQYQVHHIDYDHQVLRASHPDLNNISLHEYVFANTTIDFNLFEFTILDVNITVHIDCPNVSFVPCTEDGLCLGLPDWIREPVHEFLKKCGSFALVAVLKDVAEKLVNSTVELVDGLREGFDLTWTVGGGWCGECKSSGGVCGYDLSHPSAATCFCPGENRTLRTCGPSGDSVPTGACCEPSSFSNFPMTAIIFC